MAHGHGLSQGPRGLPLTRPARFLVCGCEVSVADGDLLPEWLPRAYSPEELRGSVYFALTSRGITVCLLWSPSAGWFEVTGYRPHRRPAGRDPGLYAWCLMYSLSMASGPGLLVALDLLFSRPREAASVLDVLGS